jgi:hypothetical protein
MKISDAVPCNLIDIPDILEVFTTSITRAMSDHPDSEDSRHLILFFFVLSNVLNNNVVF